MIYAAVRAGVFELIANYDLLSELADVLARPKMRRFVTVEESRAFIVSLMTNVTMVEPGSAAILHKSDAPASSNPDDEYLLDLVRDAAPALFVTGEKRLLELVSRGTTLIVSPSDLQVVLNEIVG